MAFSKQNLRVTRPTAPRWKAHLEICQKARQKRVSVVQGEGQEVQGGGAVRTEGGRAGGCTPCGEGTHAHRVHFALQGGLAERATTPTTMRPTTRLRPPVPGDAAKPERKAGVERARVHAQFGTASLRVRVAARQARVGRLPRVRARRRLLVAHHLAPHGRGRGGELKPARHAPQALRSVLLLPEWTGLWTCVQSN